MKTLERTITSKENCFREANEKFLQTKVGFCCFRALCFCEVSAPRSGFHRPYLEQETVENMQNEIAGLQSELLKEKEARDVEITTLKSELSDARQTASEELAKDLNKVSMLRDFQTVRLSDWMSRPRTSQ